MISQFDDYPIHQTPEPISYTASSDRFTYDRFWYNGHDTKGELYFGIGLGRYPNLGILDCGFSVVYGGKQYAFHGSRRAPEEPGELQIGPFQLHILEPMGRHRLIIDDNETGIACDLTFTPYTGVIQEGRQTLRNARHLVMDAQRIDQFGRWSGDIRVEGHTIRVSAEQTLGLKDRSWGIRPVGDAYTGGAPLDSYQPIHFMWAPIHWSDHCSLAGWFESAEGHQWHCDQAMLPQRDAGQLQINDPDAVIWDGKVGHQLEFEAGTRRASSAEIRMNDKNGDSKIITLKPLLMYRMKGIGYQHPEWGHGKWKGELAFAGESWSVDEVDPLALENIHIQQVVEARCGNDVGFGVLEQLHVGPYQPYGLSDWFDGYAAQKGR